MKYGLIVFKNTCNLGDDIQSYSIKRLLPHIDYYIEREQINVFFPDEDEKEKVKTILGGWYCHNNFIFPPSPYIDPLFISTHFTNELQEEIPSYFTDRFLSYLKQYEPIYLRDNLIKKYLDNYNIANCFSGCTTLTLEKFENVEKTNNICLVDLDYFVTANIKKDYKNVIEVTHNVDKEYTNLPYEERFAYVEDRLKLYQSSKCVITSRLHCALPCLALGVPVVLVYNGSNADVHNRISEYTKFLNYISVEEFSENYKDTIDNITKNSEDFIPLKDTILSRINLFINKEFESTKKIDIKQYFIEQNRNTEQVFENITSRIISESEERYNCLKDLEHRYQRLKLIYEGLLKEKEILTQNSQKLYDEFIVTNNELYRVVNSQSYKLSRCITKVFNFIKRKNKDFRR